jgi:hypothetical protein
MISILESNKPFYSFNRLLTLNLNLGENIFKSSIKDIIKSITGCKNNGGYFAHNFRSNDGAFWTEIIQNSKYSIVRGAVKYSIKCGT